jgi:hypothetical protein
LWIFAVFAIIPTYDHLNLGKRPMKIPLLVLGLILLSISSGCAGGYAVYPPYDASRTTRLTTGGFDPYPEDRSAPAIEGARPPGFEHPMSEPDRVRRKPWLLNQ